MFTLNSSVYFHSISDLYVYILWILCSVGGISDQNFYSICIRDDHFSEEMIFEGHLEMVPFIKVNAWHYYPLSSQHPIRINYFPSSSSNHWAYSDKHWSSYLITYINTLNNWDRIILLLWKPHCMIHYVQVKLWVFPSSFLIFDC